MKYLYGSDSLNLIYGFRGMLWQSFYTLFPKEPKNLCFSAEKNIAQ